jgi:uncharacterized membrane protein
MMLNRTERASGPVLRRYAPVLVVTLLGLVLRLLTITGRPLWFDEFGQIEAASLPLGEMLERIRSHAAAAPLDYFGTRLMLVFGETYAVRLWPALIGTAAIPLLYLAGRKWFGERVGLLAALLLAVAPFHVYYSTEARFYALSAFMAVLCLVTFRTRWFALAVALTLYTHYFAVLVPLGLVVIYRHQLRAFGLGVVAWMPWAVYALPTQMAYQHPPELMVGLSTVPTPELVARLIVWPAWWAVPIYLLVGYLLWRGRGPMLWMALAAIALTGLATYLGDYFWSPRQVIFALPLLSLAVAYGLVEEHHFDSVVGAIRRVAERLVDRRGLEDHHLKV